MKCGSLEVHRYENAYLSEQIGQDKLRILHNHYIMTAVKIAMSMLAMLAARVATARNGLRAIANSGAQ